MPRNADLIPICAGIAGWIWIVASMASLYFLVAAIFFDGSWLNILWAMIISAVAKWVSVRLHQRMLEKYGPRESPETH